LPGNGIQFCMVRTAGPRQGKVDYLPTRAAVAAEVGGGIQTSKRERSHRGERLIEPAYFDEKFSFIKTITYDQHVANYSSPSFSLSAWRSALRCFN